MTRKIEIPNIDNLIERYLSGETEQSLSKEWGIGRNVVRRRLIEHGITPRGNSEALTIHMRKLSKTERLAITAKAHAAVRGRKQSVAEMELRAKSRESRKLGISVVETLLVGMLESKGIKGIVPQKAIGIYNVDLAIEPYRIAVEVFGGHWHSYGRHAHRDAIRIPYLLNRNWHVIIVWVHAKNHPLTVDAANYIISYIQSISRNKPTACEYRMIWGNGQLMTTPSLQIDNLPLIKCST